MVESLACKSWHLGSDTSFAAISAIATSRQTRGKSRRLPVNYADWVPKDAAATFSDVYLEYMTL